MGIPPLLSESKKILLEKYLRGEITEKDGHTIQRYSRSRRPASLAQEQVWTRSQAASAMPALYNECITIHRKGAIDADRLQKSLTEIVRRHEIWRTTFKVEEGQLYQVVQPPPVTFPLSFIDLHGIQGSKAESKALRLATENAQQPFDLTRGPVLRALLITFDDQRHRLFLTLHQIIVDGISVYRIFPIELISLYEGFASRASLLADLPLQFGDFALWQREQLRGDLYEVQLEYWRNELAGDLPPLGWPRDYQRPSELSYRGAIEPFVVPNGVMRSVRALMIQEPVSLFAVLVAGLAVVLNGYTDRKDIVLGTLAPTGRDRSEFQELLGYFLNPVPLRIKVRGDSSFRQLVHETQKVISEAMCHSDIPLELLARELIPNHASSHHPFFDVAISLAPTPAPLPEGWEMTPMDVTSGGARWDLYLEVAEHCDSLIGRAQYNPDLFFTETIAKTIKEFVSMLEALSSNFTVPISQVRIAA
jgi:hypothetical protein